MLKPKTTCAKGFMNHGCTCGLDSQTRKRSPVTPRINNPPFFFSFAETIMFVPPNKDESLTCNKNKSVTAENKGLFDTTETVSNNVLLLLLL